MAVSWSWVSDLGFKATARRDRQHRRRPMTSDQLPATKADLYAAVDAMRADMRELLEQISTLIREATQK